eukprot:6351178-Prymnesium_polylepis.1
MPHRPRGHRVVGPAQTAAARAPAAARAGPAVLGLGVIAARAVGTLRARGGGALRCQTRDPQLDRLARCPSRGGAADGRCCRDSGAIARFQCRRRARRRPHSPAARG